MQSLKSVLRQMIPKSLLRISRPLYHGAIAYLAAFYFGHPSEKMTVVGVTGTAGKSSTVKMLAHILNSTGKRCGYITTVSFSDGKAEHINKHGLSMPGGPMLQKQLNQMLGAGCKIAIVECTSEGLAQNRHRGIDFDMAVFTNLSPAHIEAHGSFENYRAAKGKLFEALKSKGRGVRGEGLGQTAIVVNLDDANADYFLQFNADRKVGVTRDEAKKILKLSKILLISEVETENGLSFSLEHQQFKLKILGQFNVQNASLAATAAEVLGVSPEGSAKALQTFSGALGRMQEIANSLGIKIIIDYAPEPAGMEAALKAVAQMPHKKIVHVFGSTGGHRDVKKRFEFGEISAKYADEIVVTNDDVYDSDPEEIAKNILGAIKKSKRYTLNAIRLHQILDRKEAIEHAINIARPGDIVLLTGKGSEQFLVLPRNRRVEWDEAEEVGKACKLISR